MKWLAPIVALVLLGASLVPPAWAQPPPLTYAQPLSQAGVAAVQQRLKQNGAYGVRQMEYGARKVRLP
jgi:hypothetical protein